VHFTAISVQAPSIAVVEVAKGSAPLFDQGTVGIYTLPLGSQIVGLSHEVQTITVEALEFDTFTPLGYFFVSFEGETSLLSIHQPPTTSTSNNTIYTTINHCHHHRLHDLHLQQHHLHYHQPLPPPPPPRTINTTITT
jgi:hypothetical protein